MEIISGSLIMTTVNINRQHTRDAAIKLPHGSDGLIAKAVACLRVMGIDLN